VGFSPALPLNLPLKLPLLPLPRCPPWPQCPRRAEEDAVLGDDHEEGDNPVFVLMSPLLHYF